MQQPQRPQLNLDALQLEADKIQAWLATGCSNIRAPGTKQDYDTAKLRVECDRVLQRDEDSASVSGADAQCHELQLQHDAIVMRLQNTTEAEAALTSALKAEEQNRICELAKLRAELCDVGECQSASVAKYQARLRSQQLENCALSAEFQDLIRQGEVQLRGTSWQPGFCPLRLELDRRVQEVSTLREKVRQSEAEAAQLENQLASGADTGAQRDVLRILQNTVARLQPALQVVSVEQARLEGIRAKRDELVEAWRGREEEDDEGGRNTGPVRGTDQVATEDEDEEEDEEEEEKGQKWSRFGLRRGTRDSCGGGDDGRAMLLSVREHLLRLRHLYLKTGQRCQALEGCLETPVGAPDEAHEEADAGDMEWLGARPAYEEELWRLRNALHLAERRCTDVVAEEARLVDAAERDHIMISELRLQLRRSHERNSSLESLGAAPSSLFAGS